MSTSWEPLPSIYRSQQEFLASLPLWRRLLQKLNLRHELDPSRPQCQANKRCDFAPGGVRRYGLSF